MSNSTMHLCEEMDMFESTQIKMFMLLIFQERGARYTLINLPKEQKSLGVVAASAGTS